MSRERDRQEAGMLVLTRKQMQQIVIGRDIRITIVKLDRNQVRLGIDAPPGMTILREELIAEGDHNGRADRVGNEWPRSRSV
jgi:carbon storage regulator